MFHPLVVGTLYHYKNLVNRIA